MNTINLVNTSTLYSTERETVLSRLDSYIDRLNTEAIELTTVRSLHGQTDLTLICNNTLVDDLPALFVLKFSSPCFSLSARVNSVALQQLGIKTPTFYAWDADAPISRKVASLVKDKFPLKTSGSHFIYMEALPGSDIGHLISTQALFKLNEEDWHRCLNLFGKVAVFDLLLANDDRFYRPTPFRTIEDAAPFCNKGNLMLELDIMNEEQRGLKDFYCIDNASSSAIRTREKEAISSVQLKYLGLIEDAFLTFQSTQSMKHFARLIFSGICNHLRPEIPNERHLRMLFLDRFDALPKIMEGIEEGYRQIAELDIDDFLNTLEETHLCLEVDQESSIFMQSVLTHVRKCLTQLQGELNHESKSL